MGPNDLNQGGQEADKLGGSEKQRDNADPLFTVVDAADAVPVKKIHEVFEGQDEDDVHLWKQAGSMASNIALLFLCGWWSLHGGPHLCSRIHSSG